MPRERAFTYVEDASDDELERRARIGARARGHPYGRLSAEDAEARAVELLSDNEIPYAQKIRRLRPLIASSRVTDRILLAAVTHYREHRTPLGYLLKNRRAGISLGLAEALASTRDSGVAMLMRPTIFSPRDARELLAGIAGQNDFADAMRRAWREAYGPL